MGEAAFGAAANGGGDGRSAGLAGTVCRHRRRLAGLSCRRGRGAGGLPQQRLALQHVVARTGVDELSGLHQEDGIEALQQTEPVDGGHDAGLGKGQADPVDDLGFGGGIERAGRFVEQQDPAVAGGEQAACQVEPLALSAGEVEAAFRQRRLQSCLLYTSDAADE